MSLLTFYLKMNMRLLKQKVKVASQALVKSVWSRRLNM